MLLTRSTHHSSDCDETFTSYWKHARAGFLILKILKTVLAGVSGVALHSDCDVTFKVVVNMLLVVLEI